MENTLYISDVMDIDKEIKEHGNKIFLVAGVGAGKSSWVKNVLAKKGRVLFVTSRRAKVDEDVKNSDFENIYSELIQTDFLLITNAKLGFIMENASLNDKVDDFIDNYDYIVIDEVHSMATDSAFAKSAFDLYIFIDYVAKKNKKIICMTGTPEPVQHYFNSNKWYTIDMRKKCNYVKPKEIVAKRNKDIPQIIQENAKNNIKTIYFVNNTAKIAEIYKDIAVLDSKEKSAFGIESIVNITAEEKIDKVNQAIREKLPAIMKKNDCDKSMEVIKSNNKQAYEEIVNNMRIPEGCQLFISTSKLKEGIDIMNENVCVICENHILTNIIQFLGRVRCGSGIAYIVEDVKQHTVSKDDLIYDYAKRIEVKGANHYLEKVMSEYEGDFEKYIRNKQHLIDHVTVSKYVFFNYINDKFERFDLKYLEECRLLEIKDWKAELRKYCDEYGIQTKAMLSVEQSEYLYRNALRYSYENNYLFDMKEKKANLITSLSKGYGIKAKTARKISEELKKIGVPYRIVSKKGTAGELRNKTYWMVIKEE